MLLLAGIILVLALISYSTQVQHLSQVGQQAGRELDQPLMEDFAYMRRSLEPWAQDEARDAAGVVRCPTDLFLFGHRMNATLALLSSHETERGFLMESYVTSVTKPSATSTQLGVRLQMMDENSAADDTIRFSFGCT